MTEEYTGFVKVKKEYAQHVITSSQFVKTYFTRLSSFPVVTQKL